MKKLTILASALLLTGAAYAQGPTNSSYRGYAQRPVNTPANAHGANAQVAGASQGSYSPNYSDYNQDSYINQAGSGNYATVDQSDSRAPRANGGSTAILDQTGNNNNASQKQTLVNTTFSNSGATESRDFMKATQAGSSSQVNQTQGGGGFNTMNVTQGAGTTGNRAIQTQSVNSNNVGDGNQANIKQTKYATAGGGSGNRAEQDQSGVLQTASIDQEASNSYAYQKQRGGIVGRHQNSAYIHQGDPGNANTAIQSQNGVDNSARIRQSVSSTANNNYAKQTQTLTGNQADIEQKSSGNYAEQVQSGLAGGGGNYSSIDQSMVKSAAYTTQTGNNNSAYVVQH